MIRFKIYTTNPSPEVSTASLPDIVFMLLFFFMTVTVMKNDHLKVINELPLAKQVKKLAKKDRVITIYIGRPHEKWMDIVGKEPRIQANDKFIDVNEVGVFVLSSLQRMPEHIRPLATVSLKVDKQVSMGLISDVKQELRKVNTLKINYTTIEGDVFFNIDN